jgi:hypothetical protein
MTVGKTAICHVAGNDATAFPKTYNCVSFLRYKYWIVISNLIFLDKFG